MKTKNSNISIKKVVAKKMPVKQKPKIDKTAVMKKGGSMSKNKSC